MKKLPRFLRLVTLGILMASGLASAQSYPDKSKPIRIIVPFSAGSSADTFARAIARGAADQGVNVVVDNRAGGEAIIGEMAVKTAAPDGYTILLTSGSTQAVNPHVLPNVPYDPIADFIALQGVAKAPLFFNVSPSIQAKTVAEFIALARANPGKYTFGSGSTTMQMAGELFQQSAGIKMLWVPYKNATDAVLALAAGQLDLVFVDAAMVSPYYPRGVRSMAVSTGKRASRYEKVPTLMEEGLKDVKFAGWFGTYFPANTPAPAVSAMKDILDKAIKTKYVTDVIGNFGMEPFDEDLDAFQRADYEQWGKVVRSANLDPKK